MKEILPGMVSISRMRETTAGWSYKLWPEAMMSPVATLQCLMDELRWGKVESCVPERIVVSTREPSGATDRMVIVGAAKDMKPLVRLATMCQEGPESFAHIIAERI